MVLIIAMIIFSFVVYTGSIHCMPVCASKSSQTSSSKPKCVSKIFQGVFACFCKQKHLGWVSISTRMDLYQTFIIRALWLNLWGWASRVVIWREPKLPAGGQLSSGGPYRDIYTYVSPNIRRHITTVKSQRPGHQPQEELRILPYEFSKKIKKIFF